jgi:hypothetical protein
MPFYPPANAHGKSHAGALFAFMLTRQSKSSLAKRARTIAILAKGVNQEMIPLVRKNTTGEIRLI